MKKFVKEEHKYILTKLAIIQTILFSMVAAFLIFGNEPIKSGFTIFILLLALICYGCLFLSGKCGLCIDENNLYMQKSFSKKKVDISEIQAIRITESAMYWGRRLRTSSQKDRHGNQLYSAVFLREIIPDLEQKNYNDLDIIKWHRKKVMFKTIYDKEAIDYILTLNPNIRLL